MPRKHHPADFGGTIQCDAYGAYRTFARKHEGIELAGCWAHARRKFHEAFVQGESKAKAALILRLIGHLYDTERELRESRAGPKLREALRQSRSRPILNRIHRILLHFETTRRHLPKSLMGKAIHYALGQWPMLVAFVESGRVEIDNNLCENAIRPTAVRKKNWLFIGAEEAGWRSAVIYSIITSCRSCGINPYAYIKDGLTRLPTMPNYQIVEITPEAWAKANHGNLKREALSVTLTFVEHQSSSNYQSPSKAGQHHFLLYSTQELDLRERDSKRIGFNGLKILTVL